MVDISKTNSQYAKVKRKRGNIYVYVGDADIEGL